MQTINKKTLTTIFAILILVLSLIYILSLKNKHVEEISEEQAINEINYAEILKQDVESNPFLSNLPIYDDNYTILYDSTDKSIVVIFKNNFETLENLKASYSNEINLKLNEIGVNENFQIKWDIEK